MEGYASRYEVAKTAIYPKIGGKSTFDSSDTVINGWSPNNLRRVIIFKDAIVTDWFLKPVNIDYRGVKFEGGTKKIDIMGVNFYGTIISDATNQQQIKAIESASMSNAKLPLNIMDLLVSSRGRTFQNLEEIVFVASNEQEIDYFYKTDLTTFNMLEQQGALAALNRLSGVYLLKCTTKDFFNTVQKYYSNTNNPDIFLHEIDWNALHIGMETFYKSTKDREKLLCSIGLNAPSEGSKQAGTYSMDIKLREKLGKIKAKIEEQTKEADLNKFTLQKLLKNYNSEIPEEIRHCSYGTFVKMLADSISGIEKTPQFSKVNKKIIAILGYLSISAIVNELQLGNVITVTKKFNAGRKPVSLNNDIGGMKETVLRYWDNICLIAKRLSLDLSYVKDINVDIYVLTIIKAAVVYIGVVSIFCSIDDLIGKINGCPSAVFSVYEYLRGYLTKFRNDDELINHENYKCRPDEIERRCNVVYMNSPKCKKVNNLTYFYTLLENDGVQQAVTVKELFERIVPKVKSGADSAEKGKRLKEIKDFYVDNIKKIDNVQLAIYEVLNIKSFADVPMEDYDVFLQMYELSATLIQMAEFIYSPSDVILNTRKSFCMHNKTIELYKIITEIVNKYFDKTHSTADKRLADLMSIKYINVTDETNKFKNKPLLGEMLNKVQTIRGVE